jgi:hypothetical protein
VSTKFTFADPAAMLKRKAKARLEFLKLPPADAQRLIRVRTGGDALQPGEEDPLFASEFIGDAFLE